MKPYIDRLDPELRPWLETAPAMDITGMSMQEIADFARSRPITVPFVQDPKLHIEDHEVRPGGPLLRLYRPKDRDRDLPVFVFFHGGGFCSGSVERSDNICQHFALTANCALVTVDYRKTPEHPFPAGFNDCYDSYLWAARNPQFDPARLVVGGISAGGNLAAAVALRARDEGGPAIAGQLLVIPGLDCRLETPSSHMELDPRVWHRELSVITWDALLADCGDDVPVYASPALCEDFSGLPPAFVSVEAEDLLRDEGIDYARKLMEAGVTTDLHVYAGTFHSSFAYLPDAKVSRRHMGEIFAALERFFA